MKNVMKKILIFTFALSPIYAQAFFSCKTNAKAKPSSSYSIGVYEPTTSRPFTLILLTIKSLGNIPQSFHCKSFSTTQAGAQLTEYQCEGRSAHLFVYVTKKGTHHLANIYSKELKIEQNNLKCSEE